MKRFTTICLLASFALTPFAHADEPILEDDVFYTEEDDDLFNHGKFVGMQTNDYMRARRIERNKNWAIAVGSTIAGVATLFLVSKHHQK